jgi:hypothetical protein
MSASSSISARGNGRSREAAWRSGDLRGSTLFFVATAEAATKASTRRIA